MQEMNFIDLKDFFKRKERIKELYNCLTEEEKEKYNCYICCKRENEQYKTKIILYLTSLGDL